MATIKSSAENLTLNADGSGNDIKFQSNGSEVASIDQAGTVTATTFTGAATDATKLPLAGGSMTNMLWVTNINANNANNVGLGIWGGTTSQGIYARGNAASTNSFSLDSTGTTTFRQAGTERVKISSAGVLSASAGIELGSGIDATAANTLDDYEEGTWTPAYTVAGGGSHSSVSAVNTGTYTKVGRMVTISIKSYIVSTSGTITSYSVSLPFTAGAFPSSGMGDEFGHTGKGQKIVIDSGGSVMVITEYDGTPPIGNAYFSMGITYQTA